jgi:hypothetical protein
MLRARLRGNDSATLYQSCNANQTQLHLPPLFI